MINLKQQKIKIKINEEGLNEFYKAINENSSFVLNSVKTSYLDTFSFKQKDFTLPQNGNLTIGDIILTSNSILYYKIPKTNDQLIIGQLSYDDNFTELNDISEKIISILDKLNITRGKNWEIVKIEDTIIDSLKEGSSDIKFDKADLKAADLLENRFSYSIIKEIFSRKNTSIKNLLEKFGIDNNMRIEKEIENFEKANLITKDYVILCRKSNQQILQVSSKAAIEETSQSSFKCFICGNPIASEEIDEIITCSDFGKRLMTNDYWMLIKFLNHLDVLKIKRSDVYVQSDNLSIQKVFIRENQKLIFVVMCNKKLELNDSYHLSSLINTFNVPFIILVSPESFTHLMKSYLTKNSPSSQFIFIEDLHNFEKEVNSFFDNFEKKLVEEIFEEFSDLTYIDLKEAVLNKILPGTASGPAAKDEDALEKPKTKSKKQGKEDINE